MCRFQAQKHVSGISVKSFGRQSVEAGLRYRVLRDLLLVWSFVGRFGRGKHSPRCDLPATLDDETARRIAALQGFTTTQQDFGYGDVAGPS